MKLRDGSTVLDQRLDRLQQFDERSRGYPVGEVVPDGIRSKVWRLTRPQYGDQGNEGACVEFGITHELAATPVTVPLAEVRRIRAEHLIYHEAQRIDPWPGGSYPGASPTYEGTSVLAGVKVAQSLGYLDGYRWAFTIDEGLRGVVHEGPGVIALDWDEGLARPNAHGVKGLAIPGGRVLGGHLVCWLGVLLNHRLRGDTTRRDLAVIAQSWGLDHGDRGRIYIPLEDLEAKLMDGGEQCFPIGRRRP